MPRRIYLVGHCSPDSSYLTQAVRSVDPAAVVRRINDDAALAHALAEAPPPDLLLVNRLLDGLFGAAEGIPLIAAVHASHPAVKLMLISNYPDAQAAAQRAGAVAGFGKAELREPRTALHLAAAMGV